MLVGRWLCQFLMSCLSWIGEQWPMNDQWISYVSDIECLSLFESWMRIHFAFVFENSNWFRVLVLSFISFLNSFWIHFTFEFEIELSLYVSFIVHWILFKIFFVCSIQLIDIEWYSWRWMIMQWCNIPTCFRKHLTLNRYCDSGIVPSTWCIKLVPPNVGLNSVPPSFGEMLWRVG